MAMWKFLVSLLLVAAQAVDDEPDKNIVGLAASVPELSTLVAAVQAAGLVDTLSGPGPFTVFAPSNNAFDNLPEGVVADLLKPENKDQLVELLTYHVVPGTFGSSQLDGKSLPTVEGREVTAEECTAWEGGQTICLNGKAGTPTSAQVISADNQATNGVVHIIDSVFTLPKKNIVELAVGTPNLSTLVTALQAGKLVDTLAGPGPFTVFAPTNEAFAKLPQATLESLLDPKNIAKLQQVLTYHVVAGAAVKAGDLTDGQKIRTVEREDVSVTVANGGVKINDASVVLADVEASNGVVHVIDTVLLPPDELVSITEAAVATPDLSTLVLALGAADLADTLKAPGTYTVFAPTNEAFDKLPAAVLNMLLKPENVDKLKDVLLYHVVAGAALFSEDIENGAKVATVEGSEVTATVSGSTIKINDSTVKIANIPATNGVVHVIDTVLVPPGLFQSIVEIAVGNPNFSTLVAALQAGDLVETLSGPGPFTVFAPTNDAFAKIPSDALQSLLLPENKSKLQTILTYHVVAGAAAFSADLMDDQKITTVEGGSVEVSISKRGGKTIIKIDDAMVVAADIAASNGVVHVIDSVLIPEEEPEMQNGIVDLALKTPELSTLVAALQAADLVDVLRGSGPFTVFAPTNKAFASLPKGVLDSLLQPENKDKLVQLLTYHVVGGAALTSDHFPKAKLTKRSTVEGDRVGVYRACSDKHCRRADRVYINPRCHLTHIFFKSVSRLPGADARLRHCFAAAVTAANIRADNGVVHVIDSVLMLPGDVGPAPVPDRTAVPTAQPQSVCSGAEKKNECKDLEGCEWKNKQCSEAPEPVACVDIANPSKKTCKKAKCVFDKAEKRCWEESCSNQSKAKRCNKRDGCAWVEGECVDS